jgi:hypothetical protein
LALAAANPAKQYATNRPSPEKRELPARASVRAKTLAVYRIVQVYRVVQLEFGDDLDSVLQRHTILVIVTVPSPSPPFRVHWYQLGIPVSGHSSKRHSSAVRRHALRSISRIWPNASALAPAIGAKRHSPEL